jgi:hypothetical protein
LSDKIVVAAVSSKADPEALYSNLRTLGVDSLAAVNRG